MMDVDALRAVQTSGPTTPSTCLLRAGPDLVNCSLVECCRSLVFAGDQLNITLVPPCICAIGWRARVFVQHFQGH